ncbi:PEP-CTERM sorting domain-containing protein [Stieleria sp. JC731]|uniref:PEP-CTERM sorting domain-containing protein n=1 Tax=Pirellulaceae TaxID=2691357 RepID=UPI001E2D6D59|nr:PEP-CTERM sorting domain-containing protein [Stieleria sp. JC731]MCC9603393.1 PEP-CTERM sorting domain-containing protein [Stieleria sp. JC731]
MTFRVLSLGIAILGSFIANDSTADVVFSTFGEGSQYGNDGVVVGGPSSTFYDRYAEQFFLDETGSDYLLETVTFAVLGDTPNMNAIVSILEDNGDFPDTSAGIVAQIEVDLPLNEISNQAIVVADFNEPTAFFSDIGLLSKGQSYWLTIEAKGSDEFMWADTTDFSKEGFQGVSQDGGPWQVLFRDASGPFPLAAYSISGVTVIPEPSGALAIFLGVAMFSCRRHRRRCPRQRELKVDKYYSE